MFMTGQTWRYASPAGFEDSRIVIGAIASFSDGQRIFCCSVNGASERQPDGSLAVVSIPFLPMSEAALAASVGALDTETRSQLPDEFATAFAAWRDDPSGLTCFTVPFDGRMDMLIARQMAAIVGTDAA